MNIDENITDYTAIVAVYFYTVPTELNGVILAGCMIVRVSARPSRNVQLCTAGKQLEAPTLA